MNRFRHFIWILLAASTTVWGAEKALRVYLPHEKTVESSTLQLGQLALLLGDEALVRAAETVGLGQFGATGQELTIDRQTVLSCLASSGIDSGQVQFNGAESVCVKRLEQTITADRFLETARAFLENRLAEDKASLKLFRPAQDYVLPGPACDIELKAQLPGAPSRGVQRVKVDILQRGMEIGHEEVLFTVQYERKRLTAAVRLEAGTELSPENTRIETYMSNQPEEDGMFLPYGTIAARAIEAGSVIEPACVEAKTQPVLIKRQQQVIVKIHTELLLVSAYGEAMEDGKAGDLIRVRRGSRATNDERFVVGRVMQDGTVRPMVN